MTDTEKKTMIIEMELEQMKNYNQNYSHIKCLKFSFLDDKQQTQHTTCV